MEPYRAPPALALVRDFLIAFPVVNLLIVSFSFAAGFTITSAHIVLSLFPCLAVAIYWNSQRRWSTVLTAFVLLITLFTTAIFLSVALIDIYGDSRSYHGPAVIALSDGWNPFYDWQVCSWNDEFCLHTSKFIDHYAKGQWYISAEFYSLFGNLDAGKCMNLFMLVLCSLVAYEIARSLLPDRRFASLLIAIAISANPVAVAQLFSGMVDGLLSSTLSIFVLLLIGYSFTRKTKFIQQACLILLYLANLKFTGLVYASIFMIFIWIIVSYHEKKIPRYFSVATFSAFCISILLIGFNPYVTNSKLEKNPFAEAISLDLGASVLDHQADPEFIAKNRFKKFFISTFSVGKKSRAKQPEFAFPLTRWRLNRGIAVRFSGFGPLFSGIFIVAIFQAARLRDGPSIAMIFCVLLTVFSTSAGWWPRLAPQMWLVICLIQIFVVVSASGTASRRIAYSVLGLMLVNSALVFTGVFSFQRRASAKFWRDLRDAKAGSLSVVVTDNRFGLVGFYNRRKLVDSLGKEDLVVESCKTRRGNRIFDLCEGPRHVQ